MVVDSFNQEFGYELLSAVPYAWELHKKGLLTETRSAVGSEPLYYFSPKHTINPEPRSWFNTDKARKHNLPYTFIHQYEQPDKQFPPYAEYYANTEFVYDKPILCICNRYNVEWSYKPINYFDEEILDWMFSELKTRYEIIYFPVDLPDWLEDNAHSMHLDDRGIATKHGIKVFSEMLKGRSWNEVLLMVFANCKRFVTMNGGYSILASLFSGTNIIYSKPGKPQAKEIQYGSFWRWYPNLGNVRTLHVPSYEELKVKIQALYIDEKPCLNLLIRTHRPNYLRQCMESVSMQTYPNLNVVFICDSQKGIEGTRGYPGRVIRIKKEHNEPVKPDGEAYGLYFPYNSYLAMAQQKVTGYIMFLDDDDRFTRSDSAEVIMEHVQEDKLVLWRVNFNDAGIKPDYSFGKSVTLYDVTGIGIAYHSSKTQFTDWTPWKRADYRTAKSLERVLNVEWIDEILTGLQDKPGAGVKRDLTKLKRAVKYRITYPSGEQVIQYFCDAEAELIKNNLKRNGTCIERMS